jgi:type I restriction enzyme S subunit
MTDATRNLLEQHFDTAFAAPDGIVRLRELILTLAMQGKLVEQDPKDPPASELLKEIEAEKKRLVKEGKIKKPKPLPHIKPEEVPYDLPPGWEWVRIKEICHDWGQKVPDAMFTYIDVGAIDNKLGTISSNTQLLDASDAPSRARKIIKPGTVIYSTVRPYLLNIAIVEKEYEPEPIVSTAFAILHPFTLLSARFIYHYLRSPVFIRYVESTQKGVAYPAINDGDFFSGLFPLPPLPEQHRIVARIDQLMARCDALEKLRKEREEKRLAVHAAAIRQLLNVPEGSAWDFIEQHFGELYTVKENVAELRKAILQLAVMGRLVSQDPKDPPASELLKEIEAEKKRLVKEGKIKKPKPLPPIKPEEVPYGLPQGWEWVRLGELIELISGQHLTPAEYNENRIGHSYYTGPADFGSINPHASRWTTVDRSMAIRGDILLTVKGAGVGKTNVLAEDMAAISRQLMALRVVLVNQKYVLRFLGTIFYELQALAVGIAIPGIGRDNVLLRKFPLPPLPEQPRIVARIDQLMGFCDTLEQQIKASSGKQSELLNAVMAQV